MKRGLPLLIFVAIEEGTASRLADIARAWQALCPALLSAMLRGLDD